MTIRAGMHVGPYEIVAPIGAGGMGEVYHARDPRIDRDVAIKVLPAAVAENSDRLRRFQQEAHSAGILNHPNLLTIYEFGTYDSSPYIVSELLEGETLRERMNDAPVAPRRALDYALQIARGLAAAHEKGIVHRDLKPENIFVTKDGRVKILDFGLAKLQAPTLPSHTDVPTVPHGTDPGTVLGTAGYMSPEQVRGQTVDHRSDIFSFGSILYEMLSGRRAFKRDSSIESLNAILKEDPPDLLESNPNIPPALDRVVRHCLEKHPEARFQSARDLAFDLEAISEISGPSGTVAARIARARRAWMPIAMGTVLALITGAVGFYLGTTHQKPAVPSFQQITFQRGGVSAGRLTPDGQTIVYSGVFGSPRSEIFAARTESPESRSLGVGDAALLSLSRSGELAVQLKSRYQGGFIFTGTLARVPLAGGAPREIAEGVEAADWAPDGENLAIVRTVDGQGRIEFPIGQTLYETGGWISHVRVSPNGDAVAFVDHPNRGGDDGSVAVIGKDTRKKTLTDDYSTAQGLCWAPDGKSIWFTAAKVGATRSLQWVSISGVVRVVFAAPGPLTLHDIAPDGRVLLTLHSPRLTISALVPGANGEKDMSWLDWSLVRDLSDDGRMLLFDETGEGGGAGYSVFVRKTDGSAAVRLGDGTAVGFSPDTKWALAIRRLTATPQLVLYPTGVGQPRQVTRDAFNHQWASWFPDGKRILFLGNEPGQPRRLYAQSVAGGSPKPVGPPGVTAYGNPFSPDGKYIAAANPDQRVAIYPVNGGEPRLLPDSLIGALAFRWSSDGNSLYLFRRGEVPTKIMRFDLRTDRTTVVHELPSGNLGVIAVRITPDGKHYAYSYSSNEAQLYLMQRSNGQED